ncbi:hypothetical protein EJA05_18945 [Pseudomonas oryziphila]|uniref:Uncharacterized protein n=1 Tax=Pseudomonas entomophila TaxID=312306 RepID=A0A3S8UMN4_9PSED|nr:hypothetical protein EJA05_18945 [Pseudomonas oryziphila]
MSNIVRNLRWDVQGKVISCASRGVAGLVLPLYFSFMKLKVDGVSDPLIMRPTSSDNGTQNSLKFNELSDSKAPEAFRSHDRQR